MYKVISLILTNRAVPSWWRNMLLFVQCRKTDYERLKKRLW